MRWIPRELTPTNTAGDLLDPDCLPDDEPSCAEPKKNAEPYTVNKRQCSKYKSCNFYKNSTDKNLTCKKNSEWKYW